jgi:hypothetical protein
MKGLTKGRHVFDLITELSSQAEWTENETRKALQEEGIDPGYLLRSVLPGVKTLDIEVPCEALSTFVKLSKSGYEVRLSGQRAGNLQVDAASNREELIARIAEVLAKASLQELESFLRHVEDSYVSKGKSE